MDENESSDKSSDGWINWFCEIENHEFFVEVDQSFIRDNFNLWGLKEIIGPKFDSALEMILSSKTPEEEEISNPK